MKLAASLVLLAAGAQAVELTPDNWDEMTAGKSVFIKFFAPWCGHCKAMKPTWDELMEEFEDSNTILIADVDCTAEGKPICEEQGVQGFPTLKWGDPSMLEEYAGGRDMDSLKAFAEENLKPTCSPANLDLCDDEKKAEIAKVMAMGLEDLEAAVSEKEEAISEIEEDFSAEVQKLQDKYMKMTADKDTKIKEIKDSGLSLFKAVKAIKSKEAGGSDEL